MRGLRDILNVCMCETSEQNSTTNDPAFCLKSSKIILFKTSVCQQKLGEVQQNHVSSIKRLNKNYLGLWAVKE